MLGPCTKECDMTLNRVRAAAPSHMTMVNRWTSLVEVLHHTIH